MKFIRPNGRTADTLRTPVTIGAEIIVREDGRIERICKHGVGHPIGPPREWLGWMSVHGCDGCCFAWKDDTYGET